MMRESRQRYPKSLQWSVVVQGVVDSLLDDVPEVLRITAHEINSFWRRFQHG